MKRVWACLAAALAAPLLLANQGCDAQPAHADSDTQQRQQQERILQEGVASVGMPAIHNFREKRLLKQILEMRDQAGYVTHTYLMDRDGKLHRFCDSIGYPIPYATQYTNPLKAYGGLGYQAAALTSIGQADPNGLFSPSAADGTWVMCKDPNGGDVKPVYVEPKVVASPFALKAAD